MVYKIIDDETALTIFEAVQEKATRSFARYNCLRQLPKHKINGELLFYLDELLDFAERELKQDPSETLGQVVDFGLTAWFGNLAPEFQRKMGFSIKKVDDTPSKAVISSKSAKEPSHESRDKEIAPDTKEALKLLTQKNKTIAELEQENLRLKDNIESLAVEKVALKREIAHLEQVNEELADQAPSPGMAGYLSDSALQSGYMALTTHTLTSPLITQADPSQSSAPKKNRKRRKKKGGGNPNPVPQSGYPQQ